jgi:hypothetical protein
MTAISMQTSKTVFLCDYEQAPGRYRLWAVLDELTLTHSVIVEAPDGGSRALRRHFVSLREARAWACAYGDSQSRAAAQPANSKHGPPRGPLTADCRCCA